MVSFLTCHLFLIREIHRNKIFLQRFIMEKYGSHSAHFSQIFNVIIQALSCRLQCKITLLISFICYLTSQRSCFEILILGIYVLIMNNLINQYLKFGQLKTNLHVFVPDLLNIQQTVKIYQISLKTKYVDKISISVRDLQTSSLPLIYQTEFSDYNLRIGNNILSQHWRQKKLKANYFSDKNAFRFVYVYILI